MSKRDVFSRLATGASRLAGHPLTCGIAASLIVVWALLGPVFNFSDTWQLVINTTTTIITFLMVFLIQSSQNRDAEAVQIKLDELIRVSKAHNALLDLEELPQAKLDEIRKNYEKLAGKARRDIRNGKRDTDSPVVKS